MKGDRSKVTELAALKVAGALDGPEARAFADRLAKDPEAQRELASFQGIAEVLAKSVTPRSQPSAGLKAKILQAAELSKARAALEARLQQLAPPADGGLGFVRNAASSGWLPLRVPGAFVKMLSYDSDNGYAVALGKLEPGARYPAHQHIHAEDLLMLEGDLHVGDEVLRAGDFHHAAADSRHGVNWSENGCILLAVLSKEDLMRQFAAT